MYKHIAQSLIKSDEQIARQWFVWKMSNPHDIESFFISEILPKLEHKVVALAVMNECSYEDAKLYIDSFEWAVYTDEEADKAFDTEIKNRIEDTFWSVPSYLKHYIKTDSYKSELESCFREDLLSHDDTEYTQIIDGVQYYLYNIS